MSRSGLHEHRLACSESRATLPEGPWTTEPDRKEFEHAGLPVLLSRHPQSFHWCGYVGVPPTHPLHGVNYHVDEEGHAVNAIDVHGGLTYAAACDGAICHTPKPGESDNVWWFGFDCAHYKDLAPASLKYRSEAVASEWESYRDVPFVEAECRRLAEQLAAIGVSA